MKKFNLLAVMAVVLTLFSACQQEELEVNEPQIAGAREDVPDVYTENGYLAFKTKEAFDSIRSEIDKLSIEECEKWEKSMKFTSARTIKYFAEEEAIAITDEKGVKGFRTKYQHQFYINDDLDINYKFYASGLEDVLNIEGLVKIENSLYKFTEDKEYIVLDGDINKLADADKELKSEKITNENIIVFDPYATKSKLKSTVDLDEGVKTVGARRLIWNVEKYVYSSILNFDPYTGLVNYKAGYELSLIMNQEKYRGTFSKKWRNNEASYNVVDQFIDWDEYGPVSAPGHMGWFEDLSVGTTRKTVKVHYISKHYRTTSSMYKNFDLWDLKATFWSSGIGEANKVHIDL